MHQMDIEDVAECLEFLKVDAKGKGFGDWLIVGARQDLRWLEKNRVGKVIRG